MSFYEQVYAIVRCIPEGEVTHYGAIARMLDNPRAARAVGYALRALPDTPAYADVPWQRVIHYNGEVRAGATLQSRSRQAKLLRGEGVRVSRDYRVEMEKFQWDGLLPHEVPAVLRRAAHRL
ncbi:MAG: MGMT family protein [Anaerolineae bacterium]|nr:MAG: MGMT family protein [Anaerolineae bacterium]